MPLVLPEVLDLATVAGIFVLIGLLIASRSLLEGIAHAIDVDVAGFHPFRGISTALQNYVISAINSAIGSLESAADGLLTGLKDAFNEMIGLWDELLAGTKNAVSYLWNHGIDSKIIYRFAQSMPALASAGALYEFIRSAAHKLNLTDVTHATTIAEHAGATAFSNATTYTDSAVTSALVGAKNYADRVSADARNLAEKYADHAVSALRTAETTAVNNALSVAKTAEADAQSARQAAAGALTAAESEAQALTAAAAATFTSALTGVKSIAVTAEEDITTVLGKLSPTDAAALIASVPLIATAVNALVTETGLENQSCRSKVKNICQTDPQQWTNLLAGVGLVTGALSLAEIYPVAQGIFKATAGLIEKAA